MILSISSLKTAWSLLALSSLNKLSLCLCPLLAFWDLGHHCPGGHICPSPVLNVLFPISLASPLSLLLHLLHFLIASFPEGEGV